MGLLTSRLLPKDNKQPIKGVGDRLKNVFRVHYRGVIGCIVPLLMLPWQPIKGRHDITVRCVWMWVIWFFIWQPVSAPVTAMIPIFMLPMTGVQSSILTCGAFFNDNMALYILAGMILLMMNSCGVDRRIILWFLCSGDSCQFSGKRIIFKASTAAFFMSMFSSRLIVSSTIMQFLTPAYIGLQSYTSKSRSTEPDYEVMKNIVLNSIQAASSIGSTAVIHSSFSILAMRNMWASHAGPGAEYPDIFNYMQYTCFAFPVALVMHIFVFGYHMVILNNAVKNAMSPSSMTEMKRLLLKHKSALPKRVTGFEQICTFSHLLYLIFAFFRWGPWINNGWAAYNQVTTGIPEVKDATLAATFVFVLHILPRTCHFMKFISATKKSELGPLKPESSIMWWKFIDKNTNYGYIILIGSACAFNLAVVRSGLADTVASNYGTFLTNGSWNGSLFLIILITVFLSCIMTPVAVCFVFLPFVLNMVPRAARRASVEDWQKSLYIAALAVGFGTNLAFTTPFLYTPAYFSHKVGKVPLKKMIKYSIVPCIICIIILWFALSIYAPIIWDPENKGIFRVTTGEAPAPGPAPPGPAPEPAPEPPAPEDIIRIRRSFMMAGDGY